MRTTIGTMVASLVIGFIVFCILIGMSDCSEASWCL